MSVPLSLDSHVQYGLSLQSVKLHNPYLLDLNLSSVTYVVILIVMTLFLAFAIVYRVYQILQAAHNKEDINVLYWIQDFSTALSIMIMLVFGSAHFADRQNFTNTFSVPLTLVFSIWDVKCFLIYLAQLLLASGICFASLRTVIYLMAWKKIELKPWNISFNPFLTVGIALLCITTQILGFLLLIKNALYIPLRMTNSQSKSINVNLVFSDPAIPKKVISGSVDI